MTFVTKPIAILILLTIGASTLWGCSPPAATAYAPYGYYNPYASWPWAPPLGLDLGGIFFFGRFHHFHHFHHFHQFHHFG